MEAEKHREERMREREKNRMRERGMEEPGQKDLETEGRKGGGGRNGSVSEKEKA